MAAIESFFICSKTRRSAQSSIHGGRQMWRTTSASNLRGSDANSFPRIWSNALEAPALPASGKGAGFFSSRRRYDLHALDEVVLKRVSMAHHPVCNHCSRQIANHLVNFDHDTASRILFKAERFNTGIDNTPLPRPVLAYRPMTAHRAAFHAICPFDLRMHRRQSRVNVAAIECGVCGSQKMIFHGYFFWNRWTIPPKLITNFTSDSSQT